VKIIVDTNVLISGIFFSGPPFKILQSWRDGRVTLVVSQEILDEYKRVGEILSVQYPDIDFAGFMELVMSHAQIVSASPLGAPVCSDSDDDKFLACACAAKAKIIISGDKHLLNVGFYKGIEIFTPRRFVDTFLV
jgi:putative PIN family toxin of toxin-antitoxin system